MSEPTTPRKSADRPMEPQRAVVELEDESVGPIEGTAQIDGAWLNVWPDDPDRPATSFPTSAVFCIRWEGDRDW